jgi:hypothetical protein
MNVTRLIGDSPIRGGSRQLTPPLPAQPEVQLVRRETGEVRIHVQVHEHIKLLCNVETHVRILHCLQAENVFRDSGV